ncbi:hypothetical protein HGRIS_007265 [Hohenbuehelia grisea]|uniref:Uncharacterized protein n=1 Tax=Hohenbuehelia grisea TaxID=104357 RepID=A0ABR3JD88_9AGAR
MPQCLVSPRLIRRFRGMYCFHSIAEFTWRHPAVCIVLPFLTKVMIKFLCAVTDNVLRGASLAMLNPSDNASCHKSVTRLTRLLSRMSNFSNLYHTKASA